jgi:hypothetical protein
MKKLSGCKKVKKAKQVAPSEHSVQVSVVGHVRTFMPQVLIFAIPNGAAVSPMGRMRLVAEGLLAGVPDLFVAQPSGPYAGLFIEMKRAVGAVVSPRQRQILAKLQGNGYCCVVCTSKEAAIEAIEAFLQLPPA